MNSGLLSLKWNNHVTTFFHVLETIRKKELYSDVTIACDGEYFAVHKLVLSTSSEYFFEIFEKTQCKHPIIVLKDISSTDFERLLNYMYKGEVSVLQNELTSLLNAAECLKIKGLAVPDEPPSKKSHKRDFASSDREDSSNSKRSRKNHSSSPPSETCDIINDNIRSDPKDKSPNSNERLTDSNKSQMKDSLITNIKEEQPDRQADSDLESVVKFEDFVPGSGRNDFQPSLYNSNPVPFSNNLKSINQNEQPSLTGPSTSSYEDTSKWSGGEIELLDDDVGCNETSDYDSSAFYDPSQSNSQMGPWDITQDWLTQRDKDLRNMFLTKDGPIWKCTFSNCGYSSVNKEKVRVHVRKHTGEKPFICHLCPYKSNQSSNLHTHLKRHHLDVLHESNLHQNKFTLALNM